MGRGVEEQLLTLVISKHFQERKHNYYIVLGFAMNSIYILIIISTLKTDLTKNFSMAKRRR